MATHVSAKKRIRQSEKRKLVNKNKSSEIKSIVKKALSLKEKEGAEKIYKEAIAVLDKTVSMGRIHKNAAARKKS
ncbi:MAG TPA: 30S ribosomal protein S20, partial [Ignavibacteriaceae bacterium]|nr:30S ribosomal protein S20 [Ignavibacteriaceae bacterium]